jgi:hypothetical protein
MAKAICVNPYWLMMTCAQATNLAFMLPVAEPSNAIAFSYGRIEVRDTATAGLMMNFLGFLVITIFINTLGYIEWGLASYPCWAADDPSKLYLYSSYWTISLYVGWSLYWRHY